MAYIEVEVGLSEFDTGEIVAEILRRLKRERTRKALSEREKQDLRSEVQDLIDFFNSQPLPEIKINNLEDRLKLEHIANVFSKYSVSEIENRLP